MKRISYLMLVLVACFALISLPQAVAADKYVITTFDPQAPPGGWLPYEGTQSLAINSMGTITGFYSDPLFVYHAFVRTPDGTIAVFNAPDAGTQSVTGFLPTPLGVLGGQGTYATAMNDAGTITGLYVDATNVMHGFVRLANGTLGEFSIPGAGTAPGQGTNSGNINNNGALAGVFVDSNNVTHVFLMSAAGVLTKFDAPGAGTAAGQGTFMGWASCLSPNGSVTGYFVDANNIAHGFLRRFDGTVTIFDAPNAGVAAGQGTYAWSINSGLYIIGAVVDAGGVMHGYIRYPDGSFRSFDVPGAGRSAGQGTEPEGINVHGVIVGNFINVYGENRGFRRAFGGAIKRFAVPDAGTASGQGTIPLTNNKFGIATGSYIDNNFGIHGFLISF
ncbi:MAG TPA: hypothetical protein VMI10_02175 [Terriglobales bacterium]|nr:hypothetical protein [Terriglobales bacterium]